MEGGTEDTQRLLSRCCIDFPCLCYQAGVEERKKYSTQEVFVFLASQDAIEVMCVTY